jgi:CBS domain-containing protein
MANNTFHNVVASEQLYHLSDILKRPVYLGDTKIGSLDDLVIVDRDVVADVTHIRVHQPFGDPPYYVPWEKVQALTAKAVALDPATELHTLANAPAGAVLLKDYIVDKRVLDVDGREIEVVYDVTLALKAGRLFVIGVDLHRYALLRRLGLEWLGKLLYGVTDDAHQPHVAWNLVEPLPEQLGSFKGDLKLKVLKEELAKMPPSDVARILEELSHDQRLAILDGLETESASDTLEELDPTTQRALIAAMPKDKVARLIDLMTSGQAADVLSVLPAADARAILALLSRRLAGKVRQLLEQQEEKVVNFLTGSYIKLRPEDTVAQARRTYQQLKTPKAPRSYLYVVDEQGRLRGVITASELLTATDDTLLKDIMNDTVVALTPDETLKEASEMFEAYGFRALPVVDKDGKLLGVIPYRDVMNLKHRYVG